MRYWRARLRRLVYLISRPLCRVCIFLLERLDYTPTGYMCRVDFRYEVGMALGGNRVFPSVEDLKKHRGCVCDCGAVEVMVIERRVVFEGEDERAEGKGEGR